ncbi:MAG: FTR1 family protein [Anaerolineales bacterium]|nr:FTR1 family protein [Anaerolineales bacterium]
MLPSYLLALREGLEAALIIGIVLGALRQMKREQFAPVVWTGTLVASLLSVIGAVLLTSFGLSLEGAVEKIFEGVTMLLAAAILTWMIFWMNRQAHTMKDDIETSVQQASAGTSKHALFFLAFFAVLREGIELALFLTAATFATDARQTLIGAILGLATAVLLGWAIFASTVRLDLAIFFKVTSVLLLFFAAGLVAYGVHEFNEVGWIPSVIEHIWDINPILDEKGTLGLMLKALFGYNGNPSLTEVVAYLAYFSAIIFGLKRAESK